MEAILYLVVDYGVAGFDNSTKSVNIKHVLFNNPFVLWHFLRTGWTKHQGPNGNVYGA